ncbi:PQQ-binding-like beta-propeller repeat protein [Streptomyces sp. Qhu-G9]|uniref:outer membrane protein assembly factor BamB family protein n=1 Tax=Streptomyces sp. Qhu-G9 TaxID=3452799 RepID=UPI0022ABD74B|nr:PQQ-binding-like beta-propeller repeat protein [Streptomyces aurantiacus]WAU81881.1 PQQ-binding-like beta-propeller repeat protein [Streptomyces aurantiacus]
MKQTAHSYRADRHVAASEVVGDRLISVSWQGRVSAYSLTTGKTLWTGPVGIRMPDSDTVSAIASPVVSAGQGVVYFFSPTGELSGLDLHSGEQVWRGHVDMGEPGPSFRDAPQILLYEDVLVAQNRGRIFSLLPRIGG